MDGSPSFPRRAEDPVALAKYVLGLLDTKLADEFGVRLRMGAELEFAAYPKDKDGIPYKEFGVKVRASGAPSQDYRASVAKRPTHSLKPGAKQDAWFPESRRIAFSYMEDAAEEPESATILEPVISHLPMKADGTPIHRTSRGMAREIEALQNQLRHPSPGYKNNIPSTARKRVQHWQRFMRDRVHISLDAYHPDEAQCCGLHLNSSVEDIKTGGNLHHSFDFAQLGASLPPFFLDGLYLLTPSDNSWNRHSVRSNTGQGIYLAGEIMLNPSAHYIENKIPGADSNPYYAVMLQLLGTYHGLRTQHTRTPDGDRHLSALPPRTVERIADAVHAKKLFDESTLIRGALNDLESGLGDRFYHAIAHTPPGQEASAHQSAIHR